jgi:hypothetical protein
MRRRVDRSGFTDSANGSLLIRALEMARRLKLGICLKRRTWMQNTSRKKLRQVQK